MTGWCRYTIPRHKNVHPLRSVRKAVSLPRAVHGAAFLRGRPPRLLRGSSQK